jgi:integrase
LLSTNPVEGVRLDEPRLNTTREPTFREAEARAILGAALIVEPSKSDPAAARAKRWCPWLAAYSGARIAELTALVVEDFRQEEGVWVMHFRQTKTQEPRAVPLHEHIIAQGFLDVLSELRAGPIFFDPSRHQKTAKSAPSELRAQNIARWVRKVAKLDPEVDPNHGWRHTFKSRALGKMEQRVSDAITGHGPGSVARRYETPTVAQMAEALANFPRYEVSATGIDRDKDNSE